MRTTLAVTLAPDQEPVTIAEAKRHCRIDHDADDDLIADFIVAARIMAEGYLSRALIDQTLLWTVRPDDPLRPRESRLTSTLYLPRAPVQSVETVAVLDERGNETTIPPATLPTMPPEQLTGWVADLSLEPGRLRIGHSTILTDGRELRHVALEYIQVSFTAGYGEPGSVPASITNAIKMIVAFLYENRGDAGGDVPAAAQWLLDRHRLQFLGN